MVADAGGGETWTSDGQTQTKENRRESLYLNMAGRSVRCRTVGLHHPDLTRGVFCLFVGGSYVGIRRKLLRSLWLRQPHATLTHRELPLTSNQ